MFSVTVVPKLPIIWKNAKNKNCRELNFQQKTQGCTHLSSPLVELGDSKDCHVSNNMLYWNGKVDSL